MKSEIVFRRTDTAHSVECCAVCHQGIDGSLTVAWNSLGLLKAEEILGGSSYLFKEESNSSVHWTCAVCGIIAQEDEPALRS